MALSRRSLKGFRQSAAVAALALYATVGWAQAEDKYTLVVSSMLLDNTPNTAVQDWFLDQLVERSNGRIELERYGAGSLCSPLETTACVMDGRADIGVTVPAYTPQQFVLAEVGTLPFMSSDNYALMRALHDLNQNNPTFRSETEKLGLIPIAYFSAGLAILGAKEPLQSVEDLSGKRVRAVGDGVLQAVGAAGANAVAVTAAEMYEAAERGVVDVVFNNMDAPTAYNLDEVLPHWSDAGFGHYILVGIWMSEDAYNRLPEDLQQIVDEVTEELNTGAGIEAFSKVVATQCDQMIEGGNVKSFTLWSDEAKAEWKNLTGNGPLERFVQKAADAGYADPENVLADFEKSLKEYTTVGSDTPVTECVERFGKL